MIGTALLFGKLSPVLGQLVNRIRTGGKALQAGFTVKGGSDTDQNRAANSIFKSIPVYVWGIAVGFALLLGFLVFKKR